VSKLLLTKGLESVSARVSNFFRLRLGFWSGELFDFIEKDGSLGLRKTADASSSKWAIVVGRSHYFESVKDYPIGRLSDVKNILKNEAWRFPHGGFLVKRIERLSEDSHRVTSWVIKQKVLDAFTHRPIFVMPETVCLESSESIDVLSIKRLDETVYLAQTPNGVVSSAGLKTSFFQQIDKSDEILPTDDEKMKVLSESESIYAIFSGARETLVASPFRYLMSHKAHQFRTKSLFNVFKLSAIACATYLVASSAMLTAANGWIDFQIQKKQAIAAPYLSVKRQIERQQQQLEAMDVILSDRSPTWVVWDLFLDLTKMGVLFRAVSGDAQSVTFHVNFQRATELLTILSEDKRVVSADLVGAVRKVAGLEQFALRLVLTRGDENLSDSSQINSPKRSSFVTDAKEHGYAG